MPLIAKKLSGRSSGKTAEIYHLFYQRIIDLAIKAKSTSDPQHIIIPYDGQKIIVTVEIE